MSLCKCGGKHLYRDCDQDTTKNKEQAKPAGVADALWHV